MKISPIDLAQKTFTQAFRGYDPQEVGTFLEQVREEMEEMLKRVRELEADAALRQRELDEYKERDQSLRDTLVLAQRMSEEVRQSAERQAEVVVAEARLRADQAEHEARVRLSAVETQIDRIRALRARHVASVRGALETHRTMLDLLQEEIEDGDRVAPRAPAAGSIQAAADAGSPRGRRGRGA